jgi:hypothetical protein
MAPVSSPAETLAVPEVPTDQPVESDACAVCPHPLAAHDAISLRFCRATEAQGAANRGCVCPRE